MRTFLSYCAAGALLVLSAFAQPAVTGLQNNYSYIRPGLPNYGIAPGSIFIIYGSNMGPATIVTQGPPTQSTPLSTTLGGVTVKVVGSDGNSYQAIPYYVLATQIGAILPSATPAGNGTITVTYNGQTSAGFQIQVVKSAFGALTMNGAGSGSAAALDTSYHYVGMTNAANPGDIVTLWGTGLGSSPDSDTQLNTKFTDIRGSTQVWIGGQLATIQYAGRSQYPGLDQINVYVPSGLSGCNTSVVVQSGSVVSNAATIAVATSGRTCSDSNDLSSTDLSSLTGKSSASVGFVSLGQTVTHTAATTYGSITIPGSTTTTDYAFGEFFKYTAQQLSTSSDLFTRSSYGSCIVTTVSGSSTSSTTTTTTTTDTSSLKALDAGSSITLAAPAATYSMARSADYGFYNMPLSGTSYPSFINSGGTFSFSGPGGADVGPFNTSINIGEPLAWSNMADITTVDRANGVTVTWTGGAANTYVTITGTSVYFGAGSTIDASDIVVSTFACTAPVSAHSFTVAPSVLLALPPTGTYTTSGMSVAMPGTLSVGNYSNPVKFTATGLDLGYLTAYFINSESVTYK